MVLTRLRGFRNHMLTILLLLVLSITQIALAQPQEKGCSIKITKPVEGERIETEAEVQGTAKVPAGRYLWTFARRKGLAIWWPQGGGSASINRGGQWQVLVSLGSDRDERAVFEILALVVDERANDALNAWVRRAEDTGRYPGMRLPAGVEGCNIAQVAVQRLK